MLLGNIGVSANGATFIRCFLSLVGFTLLCLGQQATYNWGISLLLFSVVMDSVDGQLARVLDQASYFGKFLDGLVDSVTEIGLPFFLGIYLYLRSGAAELLLLGAAAAFLHAILHIAMVRYGHITQRQALDGATGPRPPLTVGEWRNGKLMDFISRQVEHWFPIWLWDVRMGGLLLAVVFSAEEFYLLGLAIIQAFCTFSFLIVRLIRVYPELNTYRRSATATHNQKMPNAEK